MSTMIGLRTCVVWYGYVSVAFSYELLAVIKTNLVEPDLFNNVFIKINGSLASIPWLSLNKNVKDKRISSLTKGRSNLNMYEIYPDEDIGHVCTVSVAKISDNTLYLDTLSTRTQRGEIFVFHYKVTMISGKIYTETVDANKHDLGWSPWSFWSLCTDHCRSRKSRSRRCLNCSGNRCSGIDHMTLSCHDANCTDVVQPNTKVAETNISTAYNSINKTTRTDIFFTISTRDSTEMTKSVEHATSTESCLRQTNTYHQALESVYPGLAIFAFVMLVAVLIIGLIIYLRLKKHCCFSSKFQVKQAAHSCHFKRGTGGKEPTITFESKREQSIYQEIGQRTTESDAKVVNSFHTADRPKDATVINEDTAIIFKNEQTRSQLDPVSAGTAGIIQPRIIREENGDFNAANSIYMIPVTGQDTKHTYVNCPESGIPNDCISLSDEQNTNYAEIMDNSTAPFRAETTRSLSVPASCHKFNMGDNSGYQDMSGKYASKLILKHSVSSPATAPDAIINTPIHNYQNIDELS